MRTAIILGGGNIGNVKERLLAAERLIGERVGRVTSRTRPSSTEAWGFEGDEFTNCAFAVETDLEAEALVETLLAIEQELGRDRKAEYREKVLRGEEYASRMIDLDVLLLGEECVVTPHVQIPHPKLLVRDFALEPLAEVMGLRKEEAQKLIRKIVEL